MGGLVLSMKGRKLLPQLVLGAVALWLAGPLSGQTRTIRVVTYNIEDDIDGATTPLPGLIFPSAGGSVTNGGVLEGIGEEVVNNDPAQPLDLLALEETTGNLTTIGPIVAGLNAFYNAPGMYAISPYQATEEDGNVADGNGPNGLVYNTTTLQLVASVPVDPPGGTAELGAASGEYREVMRYELAPAGLTPAAGNEFYVYVSHYKSGATTDDLTDRAGEAQIIRDDEATNLPANARVLYVGDYNVTSSDETSYQTVLAANAPSGAAQGQGFDPLNPTGSTSVDWGASTTNPTILAMETESATDLRYRDDMQLMTSNVYNGVPGGLGWVPGTYHTFGNNGTTSYHGSVNSGSDTALTNLAGNASIVAATLYADLTTASDHLPLVADYTIAFNPPVLQLGSAALAPGGGFEFVLSNADGSAVTVAEEGLIEIQTTTNLGTKWAALTDSAVVTNGLLQISDTNGFSPQRFYRAVVAP
jgi:hypothetical protein